MTENISGARLRSFVERIERLKLEQDDLTGEIKDIYAEAKGEGYDKAALGEIVAMRRKEAKNPEGFKERSAIVELYLSVLGEPSPSQAPAHARAHVREDDPRQAPQPQAGSYGADAADDRAHGHASGEQS